MEVMPLYFSASSFMCTVTTNYTIGKEDIILTMVLFLAISVKPGNNLIEYNSSFYHGFPYYWAYNIFLEHLYIIALAHITTKWRGESLFFGSLTFPDKVVAIYVLFHFYLLVCILYIIISATVVVVDNIFN